MIPNNGVAPMKFTDLTVPLTPEMLAIGMKIYPGSSPPFLREELLTFEKDKIISSKITMYAHTGSHLDAPGHLVRDGLRIDQIPPERWIRKGVTLDLRQTPELGVITMDDLNRAEADIKRAGIVIEKGDIVLLCTGHHERTWGSFDYWDRTPRVDPPAAQWFGERKVSGVGYDFFQEGPGLPPKEIPLGETAHFHIGILSQGIFNIEYLQNLHLIVGRKVLIIAAPLLIKDGEGAPARVVAVEGSF